MHHMCCGAAGGYDQLFHEIEDFHEARLALNVGGSTANSDVGDA